ncbi:ATP-dependent RecD-like DNA helicase [Pseudomonas [fluorescens] ATCC 17400]
MNHPTIAQRRLIKVLSIRSRNPIGKGGCIFFGAEIDETGDSMGTNNHFVVVVPGRLLPSDAVDLGQWWHVEGDAAPFSRMLNGYLKTEQQIEAKDIQLRLPRGRHLITFLSEGQRFTGLGIAKATRLWNRFGDKLSVMLDQGNVAALSEGSGLSTQGAQTLVDAWSAYKDAPAYEWLHRHGFSDALAKRVVSHFGQDTLSKIGEDPYRLLSFVADWKTTDKLAREAFAIRGNSPVRLNAAIEEALYRLLADGHTAASKQMVISRLYGIFSADQVAWEWPALTAGALENGAFNGSYRVGDKGLIHPAGAYIMESTVADAIVDRLVSQSTDTSYLPRAQIEGLILGFESDENLRLTDEQVSAVHLAASSHFCLITGGAGTGKTVMLKALYRIYDEMGLKVIQGAIAGRAAKRMEEATDRQGRTIASILLGATTRDLSGPCVLVIDEASMLDIISLYNIVHLLPEHARVVMIGDPGQLMPIGPGLTLHELARCQHIPHAELKVVKRHAGQLAAAAAEVKRGQWPTMGRSDSCDIAMLHQTEAEGRPSTMADLAPEVVRLYMQSPHNTQLLTPRKSGPVGVHALNALCQQKIAFNQSQLTVWNAEHECFAGTRFRLGDPVVCVRNLWEEGLQNGSLGRIASIIDPHECRVEDGDSAFPIAWIDWDDGARRPLTTGMLQHLDLAYALTIHKAQGSQWSRIIVPVVRHRLLDRSLIYTAITRAQHQVLLVGDEAAASEVVRDVPRAQRRMTGLLSILETKIEALSSR